MNERNNPAAAPSLTTGDVLYILFRHKWKIVLLSILAIGAVGAAYYLLPVPYESQARLWIRYVPEPRSPVLQEGEQSRYRILDNRGSAIINTELQILTSLDLARQVAETVGPERILGKTNVPFALDAAAVTIRKGLTAAVARESSVIELAFQHKDAPLAQEVLKQVIESYLARQEKLHKEFDPALTAETDQLRSELNQVQDELTRAKAKAGIMSIDEDKASCAARISRLREQLLDAKTELAERKAILVEMQRSFRPSAPVETNEAPAPAMVQPVPPDKLEEYRRLNTRIDSLFAREIELLRTFTESNSMVQTVRSQLKQATQTRTDLEVAFPGLLTSGITQSTATASGGYRVDPQVAINAEIARVSGLESRVGNLNEQLDQEVKRATALAEAEGPIRELERQYNLAATNYNRFAISLKQTMLDERVGKPSNVTLIQQASIPLKVPGKLMKILALMLVGGVGAAFALPFLIELYIDPSIKRPQDVERKLRLPLFMSVPYLRSQVRVNKLAGKQARKFLKAPPARALAETNGAASGDGGGSSLPVTARGSVAPPVPTVAPALQPFTEALRDRLITWFEVKGLQHKPKLVALTSCAEGSGVSTISAGLAAALSETGEGNVLLVDMNQQDGAAHHFRRGDLTADLDDALEVESRGNACVNERLYVVSEGPNNERLPTILPRRFQNLVPKLKASDFDYIIFDMPPVSQISLTPRLSRFMDMVLMVVESEENDKEIINRATGLLADAQAQVGVVLNKTRTYVPKSLQKEL